MKVKELNRLDIKTSIIINHPEEPDDIAYYVSKANEHEDGKIKKGVTISKHIFMANYPKHQYDDFRNWNPSVKDTEEVAEFMSWELFQDKYGEYELLSPLQ